MTNQVTSVEGVSVRLTDERWSHITEGHPELAGWREEVLEAVAHPDSIYLGGKDELLAIKETKVGKYLVVAYKLAPESGFIITAFLTRRIESILNRRQTWPE